MKFSININIINKIIKNINIHIDIYEIVVVY